MRFMRAALRLARRNLGQTWPNPAVGSLIVSQDDRGGLHITGMGATERGGRPHAERVALDRAGEDARGATCYVTLEPCAHHGRTPPCAQALIDAGISRVMVGVGDPDSRVAGTGIGMLRAAGIRVETGILAAQAALVSAGHILRVRENRPFVTLKMALTADGMFAGRIPSEIAITGEETRAYVHMMRARHDAVLTGRGTVETDDPQLTCRLPGMADRSPVRVILDSRFSISSDIAMFAGGPPVWVAGLAAHSDNAGALEAAGARIIGIEGEAGRPGIAGVLRALAGEGITRLMVEAGGELGEAFLASGLVDEIVIARSPRTFAEIAPDAGEGRALPQLAALAESSGAGAYERVSTFTRGADTLTILRRKGLIAALLAHCQPS
ncbi:MAG: bifunctional diaminohydroxyphosphoribosylaminopyrimidine deaminase/5-amino-6-(5-phosphoribosylamino)uracil reductase RibD [Rhodobiaceae bacterium]|nr:bifunctional diaminohydroxyphosphoribosylaminopyrimidine deaminase/5-amino-6-(5-phosphoribosylamino)uracil reductase RibD [Rhodobiaceae bacterium]